MKIMNVTCLIVTLLTSISTLAQQNPRPVRLGQPPIVVQPSINTRPQPEVNIDFGNWAQREILLQNHQALAQQSVLNGRDQILPVRALLGLNQGTFVRKLIIVAMTRAGQGRLEVLVNGQATLVSANGVQNYDAQVGASLETIEAEINGEIGRNIQTLQLRTNGSFSIAMLGTTVVNQGPVIQPMPTPQPMPLPGPGPRPNPQPYPQPVPQYIVCSQESPQVYQATFVRIKNFAYSGSGLNRMSDAATNFAQDWTNRNSCAEADGYMRRITNLKQFAYSGSGLNMMSDNATQFAIDNESKVCVEDTSYVDEFRVHYQFAYSGSGLNMMSDAARNYAYNKIQPKYFTCQRSR